MPAGVNAIANEATETGDCNMYVYVKRVTRGNRNYYYLVIEQYDPASKTRKRLAHISIKKILEAFKADGFPGLWCGGWDLNPRRPTPSGPEPDPKVSGGNAEGAPSNHASGGVLKQRLGTPFSQKLQSDFLEWCKGHSSESVCKQYLRKLQEIDMGVKQVDATRWHITAYKRLARYLCEERGLPKACEEFKRVKSRRSGVDLYIPSDGEVRRALQAPDPLGYFYYVLVQSGLRAIEAAKLLSEPRECVRLDGFVRCKLAWKRGSKTALWAYLLEEPKEPRQVAVDLGELEEARSTLKLVGFKYIRKWVSMKMKLLGLDDAAINFIQGRVPANILQKHYIDRLVLADKAYMKYAEWLRGFLRTLGRTW